MFQKARRIPSQNHLGLPVVSFTAGPAGQAGMVLFSSLLLASSVATTPGPVVHTDDGPIQGFVDSGVTLYHGVPFAAPPVGARRWRLPVRPNPWTETLQTTDIEAICPQWDVVKAEHEGSEDCLYLSVYVPAACSPTAPCAVMQWIHGGAWIEGSNSKLDGTHLAATYGVIIVAANYRLDALGWLALGELQHESQTAQYGNYGLTDQTLALRWTQRNIAQFGGNPDAVTIFGESAGGFSVCQHLTSRASNGLFSRAIIESGDCDGPWLIVDGKDAKSFGDVFATDVGCPDIGDAAQRLECLRELPLRQVLVPYYEWICALARNSTMDPWCQEPSDKQRHQRRLDAAGRHALAGSRGQRVGGWPGRRPPFAPIGGFVAVVDGSDEGLHEPPLASMLKGDINTSPKGEPISVLLGTNTDELAAFIVAMPVVFHGVKVRARLRADSRPDATAMT